MPVQTPPTSIPTPISKQASHVVARGTEEKTQVDHKASAHQTNCNVDVLYDRDKKAIKLLFPKELKDYAKKMLASVNKQPHKHLEHNNSGTGVYILNYSANAKCGFMVRQKDDHTKLLSIKLCNKEAQKVFVSACSKKEILKFGAELEDGSIEITHCKNAAHEFVPPDACPLIGDIF